MNEPRRFPFEPPASAVLFRAERAAGEWVLRRRDLPGGVRYELVVSGKLLMDTADGSSERALADVGLAACAGGGLRVLVGGLGFGFTLDAVLRDARVAVAEVVELEPALAGFLSEREVRARLGGADLADPRVRVVTGDVAERLRAGRGAWDCVLLDVDNGPESLSAPANAALYGEEGLGACRRALRPGGALAVWSSEPSPACLARLRAVFGSAEERIVPTARDGRSLEYRIFLARVPAAPTERA